MSRIAQLLESERSLIVNAAKSRAVDGAIHVSDLEAIVLEHQKESCQ